MTLWRGRLVLRKFCENFPISGAAYRRISMITVGGIKGWYRRGVHFVLHWVPMNCHLAHVAHHATIHIHVRQIESEHHNLATRTCMRFECELCADATLLLGYSCGTFRVRHKRKRCALGNACCQHKQFIHGHVIWLIIYNRTSIATWTRKNDAYVRIVRGEVLFKNCVNCYVLCTLSYCDATRMVPLQLAARWC